MRLVAVQVQMQYAREDPSGEVGELVAPLTFHVSAAEWIRGWAWEDDVAEPLQALEKTKTREAPA